jgi:hypothetical protein
MDLIIKFLRNSITTKCHAHFDMEANCINIEMSAALKDFSAIGGFLIKAFENATFFSESDKSKGYLTSGIAPLEKELMETHLQISRNGGQQPVLCEIDCERYINDNM